MRAEIVTTRGQHMIIWQLIRAKAYAQLSGFHPGIGLKPGLQSRDPRNLSPKMHFYEFCFKINEILKKERIFHLYFTKI
jgi:hypothetical protein